MPFEMLADGPRCEDLSEEDRGARLHVVCLAILSQDDSAMLKQAKKAAREALRTPPWADMAIFGYAGRLRYLLRCHHNPDVRAIETILDSILRELTPIIHDALPTRRGTRDGLTK